MGDELEEVIAKFQALQAELIRVTQADAERLADQKEIFYAFMNHLPTLAMLKDDSGRYVFANVIFQKWFDLRYQDVIGKTDHDLWPDAANKVMELDRIVRERGQTLRYIQDGNLVVSPGTKWLVCKFPVEVEGGKIYVGAIALELTNLASLEDEINYT